MGDIDRKFQNAHNDIDEIGKLTNGNDDALSHLISIDKLLYALQDQLKKDTDKIEHLKFLVDFFRFIAGMTIVSVAAVVVLIFAL